jgi:hypothetical protein
LTIKQTAVYLPDRPRLKRSIRALRLFRPTCRQTGKGIVAVGYGLGFIVLQLNEASIWFTRRQPGRNHAPGLKTRVGSAKAGLAWAKRLDRTLSRSPAVFRAKTSVHFIDCFKA